MIYKLMFSFLFPNFFCVDISLLFICLLIIIVDLSVSRLLVACMQSTCLEGLGGEDKVNPVLQETTFIQHTFGGRLRSKVLLCNCL